MYLSEHTLESKTFSGILPAMVDFLVIAGGGGGGGIKTTQRRSSGGGGAGGYRCSVTGEYSGGGASAEDKMALSRNTPYSVIVGAGGAGGTDTVSANNGNNSVLGDIISLGGGFGNMPEASAGDGGSGGGIYSHPTKIPGQGTTGQGYDGGGTNGITQTDNIIVGGGGGGAGSKGQEGGGSHTSLIGNGGDGVSSSITGIATSRAGGGGSGGSSGTDGGGDGGVLSNGEDGTINTGGGGGGAETQSGTIRSGGNGGSGLVVIKIPSYISATFSEGVTYNLITSVTNYKIYEVTATSTTSETVTFS